MQIIAGFVLNELERNFHMAVNCFEKNYIKMISDQYHLLVAGHKFQQILAKIGFDFIWESNSVQQLEINIDKQVRFVIHVSFLCAPRKLKVENCLLLLG